jgi:hypothetical protein
MSPRTTAGLLCLLATVLIAALAPPTDAAIAPVTGTGDLPTFVEPPRHPTEIETAVYLIGLSRVSGPAEAFPTLEVEVFLDMSWKDPRLAFNGAKPHVFQGEEAEEKLSEIWSPDPEIQNEVEQRQTESVELIILPSGVVQYEERFGATLNADLDLGRFPFDHQTFDVELQSFLWDQADCVFVINEEQTGFDADFVTPEWRVTRTEAVLEIRSEVRDDRAFSTFIFRVHAQRNPGHYLLRFMTPLLFVMGLTWGAFWMPVDQRFRVGFIALLTVVASHTAIAGDLPRLSYPTFADVLLIVCYMVASGLIVLSIVLQRIEESGEPARAAAIDRRTRWLILLLAALVLGGSTALVLS